MPGFEVLGDEEFEEIKHLFKKSKILFRHSFDHLRNNIYKVREFEQEFSIRMQSPNALAVTSGTAALRVALASLDLNPEDEIITQSFTFVATVEAIIESKAVPVITDIDETLNMNPNDLESKITANTKAIIVVHMLGVPANMTEINKIAKKYNIKVIEDTAWGCGGFHNKLPLGTIGDIGAYSFDFAKTITTGEGGMILFKDRNLFEKAVAWHDHGHENNPTLPRWEDSRSGSGFNFRMNEMQGAVGLAQLKKLDYVVKMQRKNSKLIYDAISDLPIIKRKIPNDSFETSDAFVFFVQSNQIALDCRNELIKEGLGTKILPEAITWHFAGTWDHMPELVSRNGNLKTAFTKSYDLLSKSVSLPISIKMNTEVPKIIRKALKRVFANH